MANNIFGRNIKYFADGKPRTLLWTGTRKKSDFSGRGGRNTSDLKKYWQFYENESTIFAAINSIMYNTVMVGYTLTSENEKAKEFIQYICESINLEDVLLDAARHTLIYGDSFIEKRYNRKGMVTSLYAVDPKTMIINYNQFGEVESYQQVIDGKKLETIIEPKDIIHIRFFSSSDSPYGISIIKPNVDTIQRKIETDEALFNAIQRHGTSKIVAYVGDPKDGKIPPDEVMSAIQKKLEDLTEINDLVVPYLIKIESIDEKGVQGVNDYYDLFQNELIIGLMCPEEALGQGKGSTEATARIKAILYERMINSFQKKLANAINREMFKEQLELAGFMEKDSMEPIPVKLMFNSVTEEDEALRAKWLGNLLRGFPEGPQPFSINEVRGFFGLPSRDGMDELYTIEEKPKDEKPADDVDEKPEGE